MLPALIAIAAQVGAPMIEKILAGKIGNANASLATDVIAKIATQAGTTVEGLGSLLDTSPNDVGSAMKQVEAMSPELIALYAAGLEGQFALLQAEQSEPLWIRAWRPLGMYGLGFLWMWNLVILHAANAFWKIALPQTDLSMLFQLSALYMGLYMGGHTVKDFVSAKWGSH
jgi:hypothetical protein